MVISIANLAAKLLHSGIIQHIHGVLQRAFTDVQISIGRGNLTVSSQTGDDFHGDTTRLEAGNIGVTATVGRKGAHPDELFQCAVIPLAERADAVELIIGAPHILAAGVDLQVPNGFPKSLGDGDDTVAGLTLGATFFGLAVHHLHRAADADRGAVICDFIRHQCQQFLNTHTAAKQRANTVTKLIVGKIIHHDLELLLGESILAAGVVGIADMLGKARRVPRDRVIACGEVKNLEQHRAALVDLRGRAAFTHKAIQVLVDVKGTDGVDHDLAKRLLQKVERKTIVGVGRGLHLRLVVFVPGVCPCAKGITLGIGDGERGLVLRLRGFLLCSHRNGRCATLYGLGAAVHADAAPRSGGLLRKVGCSADSLGDHLYTSMF